MNRPNGVGRTGTTISVGSEIVTVDSALVERHYNDDEAQDWRMPLNSWQSTVCIGDVFTMAEVSGDDTQCDLQCHILVTCLARRVRRRRSSTADPARDLVRQSRSRCAENLTGRSDAGVSRAA